MRVALSVVMLIVMSAPAFAQSSPSVYASDAFVNSIGVNVHMSYTDEVYGQNPSGIASALQTLGVRHVRDGWAPGNTTQCSAWQSFKADGVSVDALMDISLTPTQAAMLSGCGGNVDAIESENEFDTHSISGAAVAMFTRSLFGMFGSYATQVGPQILAPSATMQAAYASVPSLAGAVTAANAHEYFGARNPGTTGWGAYFPPFGVYGSIPYNLGIASQDVPAGTPVWMTEGGWDTQAGDTGAVPQNVQADYDLRLLLEDWNAGAPRSYLYELVDDGGSGFGLMSSALVAKSSYSALKAFIALLADPEYTTFATSAPATMPQFCGLPTTVHQLLLEKHDGTYELVMWNEAQEADPNTGAYTPVAPINAMVSMAVTQYAFSSDYTALSPNSVAAGGTVQIGTTPTVFSFK